jgi:hypothetical protein
MTALGDFNESGQEGLVSLAYILLGDFRKKVKQGI